MILKFFKILLKLFKIPPMKKSHSYISDIDLIGGVVRKDEKAFNELYYRFSQVVFNLALRIVGDRGEAEGVVQDVFFQVWQKASSYDPGRGTLSTWIINIARNRAIDSVRLLRFRKLNNEINEERLNRKLDFARIIEERNEKKTLILRALESLPEEQRIVLEMAYFEGFTHYEMAARLNEPVGTIKTRITLGVTRLRKLISSYMKESK